MTVHGLTVILPVGRGTLDRLRPLLNTGDENLKRNKDAALIIAEQVHGWDFNNRLPNALGPQRSPFHRRCSHGNRSQYRTMKLLFIALELAANGRWRPT